ncbi:Clp protease N-terminal domain-containing protein [Streptomyces sp. NPDC001435]|uniref:Clp protease N-terminal domain-containing protein n=1 Tax=Streptomyces sp. NPDC001435 TaxID=3364576 RepID=UPI0036C8EC0A
MADDRFGERARQVVQRAEAYARRLRHHSVAPGHLLLALLDDTPDGTAAEIESLTGAPAARIGDSMRKALGAGATEQGGFMPLAAETRSVLDLAPREAARLGATTVEPAHVLRALLAQGNGTVVGVLQRNGADLNRSRQLTDRPAPAPQLRGPLSSVTRDLGAVTAPVVGRTHEVDRVIQTLTRHRRNVPLLIGEPGVGKEAVARGVALAIAEGRVPPALRGRTVRALDLAAVLADPRHRARGSALVTELLSEAGDNAPLVLHLSGALTPLHLSEGTTTPLGLFRSVLEAPEVFVLGDCGRAEYEHRDQDPGLDRLVQPIFVEEPPAEDVREILRAFQGRLESHHNAVLTEEALAAAAALARDHVPDQALPGAAIGLLDEAGALARIRAARSDVSPGRPLEVTDADVSQALAACSGIRTPPRRLTTPARHDPSVWSMS